MSLDQYIEQITDLLITREAQTYAELNVAFFKRLEDLRLTEFALKAAVSGWLKATDHETPSKMLPITRVEQQAMINAFNRMLAQ